MTNMPRGSTLNFVSLAVAFGSVLLPDQLRSVQQECDAVQDVAPEYSYGFVDEQKLPFECPAEKGQIGLNRLGGNPHAVEPDQLVVCARTLDADRINHCLWQERYVRPVSINSRMSTTTAPVCGLRRLA